MNFPAMLSTSTLIFLGGAYIVVFLVVQILVPYQTGRRAWSLYDLLAATIIIAMLGLELINVFFPVDWVAGAIGLASGLATYCLFNWLKVIGKEPSYAVLRYFSTLAAYGLSTAIAVSAARNVFQGVVSH